MVAVERGVSLGLPIDIPVASAQTSYDRVTDHKILKGLHDGNVKRVDGNYLNRNIPIAYDTDRALLQQLGVPYFMYDALWGANWIDGNIPDEQRKKELSYQFYDPGIQLIENVESNVRVVIDLDRKGPLYVVGIQKVDPRRSYANENLVRDAKFKLGQSGETYIDPMGITREYIRYDKDYDVRDKDHLEDNFAVAEPLVALGHVASILGYRIRSV